MRAILCVMPLFATTEAQVQGLTTGGIVMMVLSISLVTCLSAFCLLRILRSPDAADHHHTPLDIDTGDAGEDGHMGSDRPGGGG